MNGDEYRHLDAKIDSLSAELAEVGEQVARIDTRLNTVWKAISAIAAVAAALAGWLGLT